MKQILLFVSFFLLFVRSEVTLNGSLELPNVGSNSYASLIDSDKGFMYFADFHGGGNCSLFKFTLDPIEMVDFLHLELEDVKTGVIDHVNKLAYFGSSTIPAKISKVNLTSFSLVEILTVDACNEGSGFESAQIDVVNQKAYFGCSYPGNLVKIDLISFTNETNLSFSGSDYLMGCAIDEPNGFLYASTQESDPIIYKIALSNFSVVNTLQLDHTEELSLTKGFVDNAKNLMYFGTDEYPIKIVKINLTDFSKIETISCDGGINQVRGAVFDQENDFGYFLSENGYVVAVNLTNFSINGSLDIGNNPTSMCIDLTTQKIYAWLQEYQIKEVDLSPLQVEDSFYIPSFYSSSLVFIDEPKQILYIFCHLSDGYLVAKVDLQSYKLVDYFHLIGTWTLFFGELDSINGMIYIFFDSSSGINILEVNLSDFSLNETVIANNGRVETGSFDKEKSNDFQIVRSLILGSNDAPRNIFVDSFSNYLYALIYRYGAVGSNYFLAQIELENFTDIGSTNLTDYEIATIFLDKTHQLIYFGDEDNYRICRVNLSIMMVVNDCLAVDGIDSFSASLIERSDTWGYFFTSFYNGSVDEDQTRILQIETNSSEVVSNITLELFSSMIFWVIMIHQLVLNMEQMHQKVSLFSINSRFQLFSQILLHHLLQVIKIFSPFLSYF
ncbi:hypothetical protein M0811_05926 [Anaeramoeba ignava]|uniref:Uncharacterized protein n=1 Tax=Anaeramoeba ignava TaxID=1746090 RepID=A0A9Q0LR15_ANAIG|nr:hypothetical protein M0811_05926 [Anaeramoeba ignava]